MGKYDEVNVVRVLNENPDIRIGNQKVIEIKKDCQNIGNSTHGKIDFLTKYCGYEIAYVNNIGKQKVAKATKLDKKKEFERNKRIAKEQTLHKTKHNRDGK